MNAAPCRIFLVAAEASGDALGAGLIRALKRRLGGRLEVSGVGGELMRAEGVASPFDISELSVLGILEGLAAYPRVLRRVRDTVELAGRATPSAVVLIDSWGFTLRVAQGLRRTNPEALLVKYVAPQVWASRPGRARTLAAAVDHLLSINAVDATYFEREGLATSFVGNPVLARDFSQASGERLRAKLGLSSDARVVAVLPGSRPSEIKRLMPVFGDALKRLQRTRPDLVFVLPVADTVRALVEEHARSIETPLALVYGEAERFDAMKAASVALACSGTVTTELALAGCPMVVAYKVGPVTHAILRRILTTRYATLFNIAADAQVAPELLQDACTGARLAEEIGRRLDDPAAAAAQVARQYAALDLMGRSEGDPAEAAADVVIGLLKDRGRL